MANEDVQHVTGNIKYLQNLKDRFFFHKADHSITHLCVFFEVICTSPNSSWASFHSHTCLLSHHLPLENENACCWGYSACWVDYQESDTGKLPKKTKRKRPSNKPTKYHDLRCLACMYFFIILWSSESAHHAFCCCIQTWVFILFLTATKPQVIPQRAFPIRPAVLSQNHCLPLFTTV